MSASFRWQQPEVELDDVDVGDADRRLRHSLLVVVVPLAPQPLRLVPHLRVDSWLGGLRRCPN